MDSAKLRLFAGVGGVFLGFAGVIALSTALALYLAERIGPIWAAASVGGVLLLASVIAMLLFLRPAKSAEAEVGEIETMTADVLADLPFDTVKSLVEKRPLLALGVSLAAGYALARDPDEAARGIRRLVTTML